MIYLKKNKIKHLPRNILFTRINIHEKTLVVRRMSLMPAELFPQIRHGREVYDVNIDVAGDFRRGQWIIDDVIGRPRSHIYKQVPVNTTCHYLYWMRGQQGTSTTTD